VRASEMAKDNYIYRNVGSVSEKVVQEEDDSLLGFLTFTADEEDTIRYNAGKENKTVNDYIRFILMTSLHSA
jgi:hypothetical protein